MKYKLYFQDLNEERQEDIMNDTRHTIEDSLRQEARESGMAFSNFMNNVYFCSDDMEIEEFIQGKAEEKINREFVGSIEY
jgi:hypothetical protein